ncbi:MAG: dienelactone hydrolase family protein [Bacteroidota bacterium]|nr:dienelactone hydrolase family protein [Bacteroidota bacterium]
MKYRKNFFLLFLITLLTGHPGKSYAFKIENDSLVSRTATGHPMQYYVSLPSGWNKNKKWPVVVVVEAAEKEFKVNAERFANARKQMPFIIVAPVIVTNGNYGKRDPKIYPYSSTVWDEIDKEGACSFDINGLQAVMKDVRQLYNAEEKIYITGFEAGAHLVWAMIFQHPEQLMAAVAVAGNYRNRCMETQSFSDDKSKNELPVRAMYGEKDSLFSKKGGLFSQWLEAKQLAEKHGYKNITEEEIKAKGHVPLPAEVLNYFSSLLIAGKKE